MKSSVILHTTSVDVSDHLKYDPAASKIDEEVPFVSEVRKREAEAVYLKKEGLLLADGSMPTVMNTPEVGDTSTPVIKHDVNIGRATVSLGPSYKYNEGAILAELTAYINSTYNQHYVGEDGIQALDVWKALGAFDTTCRDTAIKYLMRLGKKGGSEGYRQDLLKVIHYCVLMLGVKEEDIFK